MNACAAVLLLAVLAATEAQFWGRWDNAPWWASGDRQSGSLPTWTRAPRVTAAPARVTPTPQTAGATAAVDSFGRVAGCDCPAPTQYNPVCGSDGVTYNNPQILECANRCGHPVTISFMGLCVAG